MQGGIEIFQTPFFKCFAPKKKWNWNTPLFCYVCFWTVTWNVGLISGGLCYSENQINRNLQYESIPAWSLSYSCARRRRASAPFAGCIPPQRAAKELKHPENMAARAPLCSDTSKHRATRGDIWLKYIWTTSFVWCPRQKMGDKWSRALTHTVNWASADVLKSYCLFPSKLVLVCAC